MDGLAKKFQETSPNLREITSKAGISASSAQSAHPASALVDSSPHTFWQSNGAQPHTLTIQFGKLVEVHEIWFFLNYPVDESYTPSKLEIAMGTGSHDLVTCQQMLINEPAGWARSSSLEGTRCYMITIKVLENHLSGKDTLIRGLRIYSGPRAPTGVATQVGFSLGRAPDTV